MLFVVARLAGAQQMDVAFGFGTVSGNPASDASLSEVVAGTATPQSIGGGGYPAFSGDFLFYKKYIGVGGGVAWRAKQKLHIFLQPHRPIPYGFNTSLASPLG